MWQNVAVCENGELQSKLVWNLKWPCKKMEVMVNMGEKQKVVVKVGVESEVAMHENAEWQCETMGPTSCTATANSLST
jgi:hypothetical protein